MQMIANRFVDITTRINFFLVEKYHKIDENHVTSIRCTYVLFIYCCNKYQNFSSFPNYINRLHRHISLALRLFILHYTTHVVLSSAFIFWRFSLKPLFYPNSILWRQKNMKKFLRTLVFGLVLVFAACSLVVNCIRTPPLSPSHQYLTLFFSFYIYLLVNNLFLQ